MTFFLFLSSIILLIYTAIILFAAYKIKKPDALAVQDTVINNNSYSIIIPFRDEIENLKDIYFDLLDLKFDQNRIEVLFIDDHSSDGSLEWLGKLDMPDNFKLLSSSKMGKKQALIKAISMATGNYIITTDADCKLHPLWIKSINETIELSKPKLLVQPVIANFEDKLVCQFQYFDSLSLLGINMAVYNFQKYPTLASGANLVFHKDTFTKIEPFKDNVNITSGDDMFLLDSFVKHFSNSIVLNYSPENLVITKSESSWIKLIDQRMRWVGKMKRFNNSTSFFLGLLSLMVQVMLIGLLFLSAYFQNYYAFLFVSIWLFKSTVDYLFLRRVAVYVDQKVSWLNVFVLEPVYMIFVPLITVLSLFKNPKWKGREILK